MSDQPNTGPNHETLANLHAMLPSYIKGLANKKIGGKGIPAVIRRPRKCCKVCCIMFSYVWAAPTAEMEIKPGLCRTCGPALRHGYVALVCGDKYALIKSLGFKDNAGEIIQISPYVMEAVEKELGLAKLKINGINKPTIN